MEIFQTTETEVADMQLLLASGAQGVTWSGTLVFEGEQTGDGRLIEKDALYWEDGGVPLRAVLQDVGAHDGAVVVGRITDIQRSDDGRIGASGFLDLGSEAGREMRRLMAQNLYNGVSVDLDDVSFEVRVRPELLDEDGDPPALEPLPSPDEMEVVHEHKSDDEVMVITSARIRAATLVAIPAFANARIDLDDVNDIPDDQPVSDEAVAAAALDDDESPAFVIVASANADCPPAEWFENPGLSGPTALTVTEGGRVFGHLATWGTEHLTHPGVTPPRSSSDYRYFHTGATLLSNGHQIPTGRLTVDTGHAAEDAAPLRAMAHYDNTGTAVADVCVGEDSHGIWFAGAVRPTATDEQVRVLRGSPLSGDWRRIGGSLELVAALAVNVGGFPVPRGLVASGHMQSLITSTALPPNLSQKFVALTVDQAEKLDRVIDILDRKDQHHKAKVLTAAATVRNKLTAQRAEALAQILKDKKEG